MNISEITDAMQDEIVARNCFLVEINVSKDNDVEIVIESEDGIVTLDDCVELSRIFEEKFDRNVMDYELTVTSAGLDQPFKVPEQYRKAVGSMVEVSLKGGRRIVAMLESADADAITLKYTVMGKTDGSKKKTAVEHTDSFPFDGINAVKPYIDFR